MRFLGLVVVACLSAAFPVTAEAAECPNSVFCGGWLAVCKRTLPPGGSIEVCRQRHTACLSSGCFHFNVPRPRCKSNLADLALTTACQRTSR